jgi:hypothetical protein
MSPLLANGGALHDHYDDLAQVDRRGEITRFTATRRDDRSAIHVYVLSPALAGRLNRDAWHHTLADAEQRAGEVAGGPLAWGTLANGALHVAFVRIIAATAPAATLLPADLLMLGTKVARELASLHALGLVHGAINATRIGRTETQFGIIGDVGIFAALRAGGLTAIEAASALSDRVYVSPETLQRNELDERSDVFSLGAALFELLTGKPPHGGRTTSTVMANVLSDDGPTAANSGKQVVEALLRAIEHDPDDRWATAAAFAAALAPGAPQETSQPGAASRGCLPFAAGCIALAALLTKALL